MVPDYTTLDISYIDRSFLLNLPFLAFTTVVNLKTGEAKEKKIAIFYGMKIVLYKDRASLKGSFHHAYNQMECKGSHNCNDFNYENFKAVVRMFQDKISLDPAKTKVITLEFGVNILIPFSATQLLDKNFFGYKFTSGPEENRSFVNRGKYKKYSTSQYEVKVYDKARHCHLSNHMLRVELRTLKSRYTQQLKINTLEDLLNPQSLNNLASDLIKRFNEILILDKYCSEATAEYWIALSTETNPRTFRRRKVDFLRLMERQDQLKIKKDLLYKIETKLKELLADYVLFSPLDKG